MGERMDKDINEYREHMLERLEHIDGRLDRLHSIVAGNGDDRSLVIRIARIEHQLEVMRQAISDASSGEHEGLLARTREEAASLRSEVRILGSLLVAAITALVALMISHLVQ